MQDEYSVYDMKLSVQDQNLVNDVNLSDVTDDTDNNNEDRREKLKIAEPPKMLKLGQPKRAETTVIGLLKKEQT